MQLPRKHAPAITLAAVVLAAFLLYFPGLYGTFILDDHINIIDNDNVQLQTLGLEQVQRVLDSGIASTLARPLSMLTFGLNFYFSGFNPFAFKLTNLLIHLLTTTGVYLLSREIFRIGARHSTALRYRPEHMALAVCAMWALHPLNASTVLYVVQRMTQLSALLTIYSLYFYCRLREVPLAGKREAWQALGLLLLAMLTGVLCKENAALLPLFLLVLELFLFRFRTASPADAYLLRLLAGGFLVLPGLLALALLAVKPALLIGDYSLRDFTMSERLMTEARVLWTYTHWLLLPDTRAFTFYHDHYPVSRGLLQPATTLLALIGLAAVLMLAWYSRKRQPLIGLGIAFFLAGHAMESGFIALELVFEHRNYLPSLGVLIALVAGAAAVPASVMGSRGMLTLLGGMLVFLAHGTYIEARKWSNPLEQLLQSVALAPQSHRINYSLGMLYAQTADLVPDRMESLKRASEYFLVSSQLDPHSLRGHLGYILTQSQLGQPVEREIVEDIAARLETSQLMQDGFQEISKLTDCLYSGDCEFPPELLVRMYNAIGHNTRTNPIVIQGILDQIGTALITVFNRVDDGKALLYLARSKRDAVTLIDLKLIQLEIQAGNLGQAEQLLDAALSDADHAFRPQLESLLERLQEARTGA